MFDQLTLWDSPNVTSSQESASGHTRCVSPVGRMIAPFGQDHALANLSARQAKEKGLLMSGTFGLCGSTSSASADQTRSLVSKLRPRLNMVGSTLFSLTWKASVTPSGRAFFLLRAVARRTSGTDYGLLRIIESSWTTPSATDGEDKKRWEQEPDIAGQLSNGFEGPSANGGVGDYTGERCGEARPTIDRPQERAADASAIDTASPTNGFWRDADWLLCRDGKFRPVEPGTFPLVDGATARVGRLRGYGNAIVAPLAAEFIKAYMEV